VVLVVEDQHYDILLLLMIFTSFPPLSLSLSLLQHLGKKVKLAREVIRDVVGLMPYEKRILDVLKTGGTGSEKKVYKFAKRRVSSSSGGGGGGGRRIWYGGGHGMAGGLLLFCYYYHCPYYYSYYYHFLSLSRVGLSSIKG